MDLKDIKAIIDLMKKNSIAEFELEKPDFKVRLRRGPASYPVYPVGDDLSPSAMVAPSQPGALPTASERATPLVAAAHEAEIKSPMIGTFYRTPSPDAGPYVDVGTEVSADTVVCIIEAMKVMNEIKAEVRGVITQVLTENAKPVEFGQPLFKIRPL